MTSFDNNSFYYRWYLKENDPFNLEIYIYSYKDKYKDELYQEIDENFKPQIERMGYRLYTEDDYTTGAENKRYNILILSIFK